MWTENLVKNPETVRSDAREDQRCQPDRHGGLGELLSPSKVPAGRFANDRETEGKKRDGEEKKRFGKPREENGNGNAEKDKDEKRRGERLGRELSDENREGDDARVPVAFHVFQILDDFASEREEKGESDSDKERMAIRFGIERYPEKRSRAEKGDCRVLEERNLLEKSVVEKQQGEKRRVESRVKELADAVEEGGSHGKDKGYRTEEKRGENGRLPGGQRAFRVACPVDGKVENVVQYVAERDGERKCRHVRSEKCRRSVPPGNPAADSEREKGDKDIFRARHLEE